MRTARAPPSQPRDPGPREGVGHGGAGAAAGAVGDREQEAGKGAGGHGGAVANPDSGGFYRRGCYAHPRTVFSDCGKGVCVATVGGGECFGGLCG